MSNTVTITGPSGRGSAIGMRTVATGMLVLMAGVFFLARSQEHLHPAWGFVRAFAEAAMVGGLADWFAVTALFRHPLGLPIPHTAIIPRNKDRIGDTLAVFLKQNFLIPRLIARKMQSVDVAGALGRFLAEPSGGETRIRLGASRMIADAIAALDPDRLGGTFTGLARDTLRKIRLGPLLGQIIGAMMAERRHQPVLEAMVAWASRTLEQNDALIRQVVHDNSNALIRFTGLDETIANRIITALGKLLTALVEEPEHPIRMKAETAIMRFSYRLQHDPQLQADVDRYRDELLANPAMTRWLDGLWQQWRGAMLKAARDPETLMAGQLGDLVAQVGRMLGEDEAVRATINRFARRAVVGAVDSYGDSALKLVSDTVRSWDAKTITDRLETTVGPDLQFIRINGTLVGGLVGLLIHAVDVWL